MRKSIMLGIPLGLTLLTAASAFAQLTAFAEGTRRNDINEQMRVIAHELKPEEMHAVAGYYGAADDRE